ncbi:heterokaryon incompatibility protein-domain-containing protein [Phaeosphaeria sp. MPI-PUGE-AT-0046c]|nr:heterokaryon incompatibility protein-domain-containing protein [Phaeosphaeria sp. MPI-PUGE-AT-0046c]
MRHHADTCGKSQRTLDTVGPASTYLIDLKSKSLVRKNTSEKYAALSYVWGEQRSCHEDRILHCTVTSLPRMQEKNFFTSSNTNIPHTIVQAMAFTALMGLQYLWVDRFCIVQDDRWEKHNQLRAMGSIYLHAHFVIIATEGDGNYGLRRKDPENFRLGKKRHIEEVTNVEDFELAEIEAIEANMGIIYEPVTAGSRWSTRGWTFQEQMFARRSFIFRGNVVTFQCQQGHQQEGTKVLISHKEESSSTSMLAAPKWPDMLYFRSLLEDYTARDLTYPCDSLDAFEGVLDMFRSSFPGDFHFGLPEVCFDIALLWQPQNVIVDRVTLAEAERKPTADLPTWSWARWKGNLNFTAWEASAECLFQSYYSQNILRITNIVNWQKRTADGTLAPIVDDYTQHRDLARMSMKDPPDGWLRQRTMRGIGDGSSLGGLLQDTNHMFTHRSLGGQYPFRFPIPLSSNSKNENPNQYWEPQIVAKVQRAFLSVGPERLTTKLGGNWFPVKSRMNANGIEQVGVVQLHDELCKTHETISEFEEFISISAGELLGVPGHSVGVPWDMLDGWELDRRSGNNRVYEFYNVMLIDLQGDIATRRGLGRVQKELWKDIEKEEIEVVLR